MAVDILQKEVYSYRKSNGTMFIFLIIFQIIFFSQFKLAKHKTSQVKPSKLNIHSQAKYCGLFELNVTLALFPVYRCLV